MLRVALTGGIASGKTAVSDHFASLGVTVVDTDVIARELVQPGSPALTRISEVFGPEVIQASGELDRRKLREMVFSDPAKRQQLESILHPLIMHAAGQRVATATGRYCIVVIPLLHETGPIEWIDRVLLVDAAPETQLSRLMQRDGVGREQALAAMAAQVTAEKRRAIADDVITNEGSLEDLHAEVERLHQVYLAQAQGDNHNSVPWPAPTDPQSI